MRNERLEKIRQNMSERGIEQLIIADPDSVFYLAEEWIHPGERMMALYVNMNDKPTLVLNALFPIEKDLGVEVVFYDDTENPIDYLSKVINLNQPLGIDKIWPSKFLINLMEQHPSLKVMNSSVAVDEARMVKTPEEIDLMRKASLINDQAMGELVELIKSADHTELEAGQLLGEIYKKYDTHQFSFDPLICYGKNAAEPHHGSDATPLGDNQSIIIDIGGITNNYASDMTRSFFFGEPSEEYVKIYDLVKAANQAGIDMVKPGVKFSDIDKAARSVIAEAGYGAYFTHRTGHNIGINVHEYPDVSATNDMVVREGMVFSVEPGIYLSGKYGVRIEDLVVVTENGCEVLNKYPKTLRCL
ncbi:MAG: aminopeptidase P family protein [Clostridia bacterium]|nr:aminopeptidase P family protein [Clostridia bacterium]